MSRGVPPIDLPDALDPEEDRATEGWGPFLRYDLPAIIAAWRSGLRGLSLPDGSGERPRRAHR
jgi:hypothetical protein